MTGRPWVIGVDVGGGGVRVAAAPGHDRAVAGVELAVPTRLGGQGVDAGALLEVLLPALTGLLARVGAERAPSLAIGATGMALLGRELAERLPGPLAAAVGAERLTLASDAVTAYAGAVGARPGVVVAGGTGLVALATDLGSGWHRADGWGQLLGDCGSGAWIGRAGLAAALRAVDGRSGGSAELLARAELRFGPAAELPAALQPRPDRAALLASFVPDVGAAAEQGDPVARSILERAAGEIADSALAAGRAAGLTDPWPVLTGGLFRLPLLHRAVQDRLPGTRPAEGPPLLGALRLAVAALDGVRPWPVVPPLLDVRVL
ncbi:BadF/BadG/BcrA/BcrD ATPase family protein [Kitasatospora sp. NPDC002040]|uniref:BadF/BadG/BcrA/BcrD ATPase family protein n=1 Tax=Kitasatospora sp. NPDC002040 TaxID=3154661 RepID=UPI0033185B4F